MAELTVRSSHLGDRELVTDECPHHRRDSSFAWVARYLLEPWDHISFQATVSGEYMELRVFNCMYCGKPVLVQLGFPAAEASGLGIFREAREVRIVYPRVEARKLPPEAPKEIASLWTEAQICINADALRGAAGYLRGAVEQIVKTEKAAGKDLQAKIEGLRAKMTLDGDLITALHDTRLTGNWSLHDGMTFTREEVVDLAHLVEDAVEILYVQLAKRQAMAAARTKRRGGKAP